MAKKRSPAKKLVHLALEKEPRCSQEVEESPDYNKEAIIVGVVYVVLVIRNIIFTQEIYEFYEGKTYSIDYFSIFYLTWRVLSTRLGNGEHKRPLWRNYIGNLLRQAWP